ncbi:hypothetical protein V8C44DRAFT_47230 [Trichoderma aethiopicum]
MTETCSSRPPSPITSSNVQTLTSYSTGLRPVPNSGTAPEPCLHAATPPSPCPPIQRRLSFLLHLLSTVDTVRYSHPPPPLSQRTWTRTRIQKGGVCGQRGWQPSKTPSLPLVFSMAALRIRFLHPGTCHGDRAAASFLLVDTQDYSRCPQPWTPPPGQWSVAEQALSCPVPLMSNDAWPGSLSPVLAIITTD